MGNYTFVLSLLSSLDYGRQMKRLVDAVIDTCEIRRRNEVALMSPGDAVVNLRENVIEHRIKYSVAALDDKSRQALLVRALRSVSAVYWDFCVETHGQLEQYFDLIAFAEYVEDEDAGMTGVTFRDWLKVSLRKPRYAELTLQNRPEIFK